MNNNKTKIILSTQVFQSGSAPSLVHYLQVFPVEGFSISITFNKENTGFTKIHPKTLTYNEFLRLNSNLTNGKIKEINFTTQPTLISINALPMDVQTSYNNLREGELGVIALIDSTFFSLTHSMHNNRGLFALIPQ